jgi:hypothetical protein
VIVPPDTPHAVTNTGEGLLWQIDILPRQRIITEWLEDCVQPPNRSAANIVV